MVSKLQLPLGTKRFPQLLGQYSFLNDSRWIYSKQAGYLPWAPTTPIHSMVQPGASLFLLGVCFLFFHFCLYFSSVASDNLTKSHKSNKSMRIWVLPGPERGIWGYFRYFFLCWKRGLLYFLHFYFYFSSAALNNLTMSHKSYKAWEYEYCRTREGDMGVILGTFFFVVLEMGGNIRVGVWILTELDIIWKGYRVQGVLTEETKSKRGG